jgi:putative acyl-CoA dehydrogenase
MTALQQPRGFEAPAAALRAVDEVFNQSTPLENVDLFSCDTALCEAVKREGADWALPMLREVGALAGRPESIQWGREANAYPPVLRTHDPFGHRIDEVEFHPSWHRLMEVAVRHGMHALPWRNPRSGAHVARLAAFYVWSQVEAGHGCPISMTYAAVPALRKQPELARNWEPLLTSLEYDFGLRPPESKRGILCGMAMTERQGGSDVRANTTQAEPAGAPGPGREYLLTGHKWFCSAPMCDIFLVLAQAPRGLTCFLVPRILPDGARNAFRIQRLKDKLGNRSNASSEIELDRTWAVMVGAEGRGVPTIIEMVNCTRLDCVAGSASLMRHALSQALHHAGCREAFGRLLLDQPLMRNVLADLAIESEAACAAMARLAGAADRAPHDEGEAHLKRLGTAISKYWVCKRAPSHVAEALECLGGNGYVEESVLPRLYREAPVNSIWEGSGNVACLDALRAMSRDPDSVDALFDEIGKAKGANGDFDRAFSRLRLDLADLRDVETRARRLVERMAMALQGSLLIRYSDPAVADAFCSSRLAGAGGYAFGTLPAETDFGAILRRCLTPPA